MARRSAPSLATRVTEYPGPCYTQDLGLLHRVGSLKSVTMTNEGFCFCTCSFCALW